MRVAVVGGGWAGLAAAVRAVERGHEVVVFEMAPHWGGRARSVEHGPHTLDNGQHILIGAYVRTLALMRTVGADASTLLHRQPLELRRADGRGLALPPGAPLPSFLRGVLACDAWTLRERLALLRRAARWAAMRFRCPEDWSVQRLAAGLPAAVRGLLIEPLCVAALNTPAAEASGRFFLRVLRDALFSGPGGADLLLPRAPLGELLPQPACRWLAARGAQLRPGTRVRSVLPRGAGWQVDGEAFDAVVLAASATEAARVVEALAAAPPPGASSDRLAGWAALARAMRYEPITTAWVDAPGRTLPATMVALAEGPQAPAQFAFDLGRIGGPPGRSTFVVSAAAPWVERGATATAQAVVQQARSVLGVADARVELLALRTEKRATFRCTPGLQRPGVHIARGLVAAGDYLDGPYPATLEGAVRSAESALARL